MNAGNPRLFAVLDWCWRGNIITMNNKDLTMRRAFALLCLASASILPAAAQTAPRQDAPAIRQAVNQFLNEQARSLGEATVEVGRINSRLNLPRCAALQAFLPRGSRAWGQTTVGVRCTAPTPWTVYVSATVKVNGSYVAAAVPLAYGQQIRETDVAVVSGDLSSLPAGVVTDPAQAVGRMATTAVMVGEPLRMDALRAQHAVKQGQVVRLVSSGQGFRVSVEGRALTNAAEGQTAQAKTPAGNLVSGIARSGGIMEVAY